MWNDQNNCLGPFVFQPFVFTEEKKFAVPVTRRYLYVLSVNNIEMYIFHITYNIGTYFINLWLKGTYYSYIEFGF